MKKLLLAGLFAFSLFGNAIAQEEEGQSHGPPCMPFERLEPQLKEKGYGPIFLGLNNKHINFGIVRNEKDKSWYLIKFGQSDKGIIACLMAEGTEGVILQEDTPPPSLGI